MTSLDMKIDETIRWVEGGYPNEYLSFKETIFQDDLDKIVHAVNLELGYCGVTSSMGEIRPHWRLK